METGYKPSRQLSMVERGHTSVFEVENQRQVSPPSLRQPATDTSPPSRIGHEGGTRQGSQHRPSGFGVRVTGRRGSPGSAVSHHHCVNLRQTPASGSSRESHATRASRKRRVLTTSVSLRASNPAQEGDTFLLLYIYIYIYIYTYIYIYISPS